MFLFAILEVNAFFWFGVSHSLLNMETQILVGSWELLGSNLRLCRFRR